MNRTLLAVGVTAIVLGALVALVPLFQVASGDQTVGNGTVADFQAHSLVFPLYIQVPWSSSNGSTELFAVDCGSVMPTGSSLTPCPQGLLLAKGGGASGTLSFLAHSNEWIYIGANNGTAKISLRVSNGEVGFTSIVLGGVFLALGLTVRPRGVRSDEKPGSQRKRGTSSGVPDEEEGAGEAVPRAAVTDATEREADDERSPGKERTPRALSSSERNDEGTKVEDEPEEDGDRRARRNTPTASPEPLEDRSTGSSEESHGDDGSSKVVGTAGSTVDGGRSEEGTS